MARIRRVHRSRISRAAIGWLVFGAALAALVSLQDAARAPPPIPLTTVGDAYGAQGNPLPIGTPIRTFVDGVEYSNASQVLTGAGAFEVATAGNWLIGGSTPEPSSVNHGADIGERVIYAAGDFTSDALAFQEVTAWAPDTTLSQDLHLGAAFSIPAVLKIEALVPQPAAGGAQYVVLCNPTSGTISLSDYYLQVDRPGTYFGGNFSLAGAMPAASQDRVNLTAAFPLVSTGDALKLVFRNPGGGGAAAGGADLVVDRVEYNATLGGTLDWQPGATIMGAAAAPGPGQMLTRDAACTDTNSPSDFRIAPESGLPAAVPPTVSIDAPGQGASVSGGTSYTVRWTMASNVYSGGYLRVWVNVTAGGNITELVAGSLGATSVDWLVPTVTGAARVQVDVIDPAGNHGSAAQTFRTVAPQPYSVVIAILLVVVVVGFVLGGVLLARRRRTGGVGPPPPTTAPGTRGAAPAAATSLERKLCPRCGRETSAEDETCPACGHAFVKPPTSD